MTDLDLTVELRLWNELELDLSKYTPGLRCQVYKAGKRLVDLNMGNTWTYYDLASMTKQIFTVPAMMKLVQLGEVDLYKDIGHYLWWWPHQGITLEKLLNQTSGLPWWRPFYKKLNGPKDHHYRWNQLKDEIYKSYPDPTQGCVYSDLGFMTMGFIIEEIHNKDLDKVWNSMAKEWGVSGIHFNRNNKARYSKKLYAPTEKCPWRKRTLQGEVHDDNCWALGGVSTHAGLFGKIEDVSKYGLLLRKTWKQRSGSAMAKQALFKKFTSRSTPESVGDWGLGFWKRSRMGSSAGDYFSNSSFGCLGFTGTSLWYDPKFDILVTILSNRVHPTRNNNRFKDLRPLLHNIIREEIVRGGY